MDEVQNQRASSSLSDRICNYDVFISFRGEDTRKTFVSHLDKALFDRGIVTFKDDRKIKTGEFIVDELRRAIRTSRFAIVVISENYATSRWCLDELQLILEEKIEVVPIFYEVKPSDLKHHRGSFSLDMYQGSEMVEKVAGWKKALRVIADVKGKESTKCVDDALMIEEIVQSLSSRLLSTLPIDFNDIVGMKAPMKVINPLLDMDSKSDDARIIGISGTGGIGKTTIAKYLYEQLKPVFSPRHYFMENVAKICKEHGLLHLQHQLLSNIFREENLKLESIEQGRQQLEFRFRHVKVLLVLDDVDDMEQLFALAKDVRWFGPRSRIIITTRDKSLLNSCRVYDVKYMDDDKAIQLFQRIAFEGDRPPSREYRDLSNRVIRLAQGLPLALKAFGFVLQRKSILEWEDALGSLEKASYNNMMRILNISYNRLDEVSKRVFVHVACISNGEPVKRVMTFLDRGEVGIKVLAEKSLIDISADGRIRMNHLLRQLGTKVMLQEAQQQILWNHYFIYRTLADNAGTTTAITEGVSLDVSKTKMPHDFHIEWELFKPMENLNFLKIYNNLKCQACFDSKPGRNLKGNSLIPCNLRLLHWDAYPFTTLPSIVHFDCLVELNLSYSKLITLWNGTPRLSHLKKLNLTGSKYLKELPDLQEAVYLEELMLRGCVSLTRIPKSICSLPKLQKLDLLRCCGFKNLRTIVRESESTTVFGGRSLHVNSAYVDFLGAEPLVNESQPQGSSLTDLSITGSLEIELRILKGQAEILWFVTEKQTPHQLKDGLMSPPPYGFKSLDIARFNCNKESNNPFKCFSFLGLLWLKELNLINLNIQEIPDDIHHMQVLEKLDLTGNDMRCLPSSMMLLSKLKHVTLCNCRMLVALPELYQLETLTLSDCTELRALVVNHLPQTYQGRSYSLLELRVDNCKNVVSLSDALSHFKKLRYLDISRHDFETVPSSIKDLSSLLTLCVNYCNKLKSLTRLPTSLRYLYAHGCMSLESSSLSASRFDHLDISPCLQRNMDYGQIIRFPCGGRSEEVLVCLCAQKSMMIGAGTQGRSSVRPDPKQRLNSKNLRSSVRPDPKQRLNSKNLKLVTLTIFTGVLVCFRRWATASKSI